MRIFITLFILLTTISWAQIIPEQPDFVGRTTDLKWATLIQYGGGKFFISVSHHDYFPQAGDTLYWGNGETSKVQWSYAIRGGARDDNPSLSEYDLSIGKVVSVPSNITPVKVWWKIPPGVGFIEWISLKTFTYKGWSNVRGYLIESDVWEANNQCVFFTEETGTIVNGDSGAPVFYKGRLLGPNFAKFGNPSKGGALNPIFMVLRDFSELFPEEFRPPADDTIGIEQLASGIQKVTVRSSKEGWKIMTKINLSDPWFPIESSGGFQGYEECPGPWETTAYWDTTASPRGFFGGEQE